MIAKYSVGESVRVISYGELIQETKKCKGCTEGEFVDRMPEIIGKTGTVNKITFANGLPLYSLTNIPEKKEYYYENQLQKA